ncbi:MAG: DPP IV N-terminal domain-containing protein [Methylococcales bacterium]|nr:DPP IV N-terminal domain-containing protein [Methylococcales bacterium]MDP3840088.1 DPP IV N-terminal domain-containing protein [Methylococcales bacterium]
MLKRLITLLLTCICLSSIAYAAQVSEKQGNIYYDNQQLTSSGKDSMAALSPDGKQVVFVRDDALWLMDVTGNNAHAIVVSAENDDVKQNLTELNNPRFSLDSKAVYFLSAAWVTSNAVHVVDLATHKQHFVTDGNSLELIPTGKYRGYLIVSKHKYHQGGGSYEDFWLVSPKGKAIKSLGEEEERVNAFLKAN